MDTQCVLHNRNLEIPDKDPIEIYLEFAGTREIVEGFRNTIYRIFLVASVYLHLGGEKHMRYSFFFRKKEREAMEMGTARIPCFLRWY